MPPQPDDTIKRATGALLVLDRIFFFLGAVAAAWMAYLTIHTIVVGGLHDWWLFLVLWVLVAYLLLPRIQTILAHIYVPDYFIGRTRIYEGLLGDPVNIALLGSEKQLRAAMTAAGWQPADELGFRSGLRIVASTLSRRPYPTAPVSALYLFNRIQDFAYEQEVAGSPAQRHHVRFWSTASGWRLPGGTAVDWVAAATFDRKVGISDFTLQVTHKVADDTDVERDHVVDTLLSSNPAASKTVIDHFSSGYHGRNGGGDAIETDGNLPIVDLSKVKAARATASGSNALRDAKNLAAAARAALDVVRNTAASNQSKRPLALYTSGVLMIVRLAAAVLTIIAASARPATPTWWLGLVLVLVGGLAYLVIVRLTFNGHPVARVIAMALSVAAIATALALGHAPGGFAKILWAISLGLDLGILFTLSGDDVRDYHLRAVAQRRK
jgi:LssY C-terminus